MKKHSIDIHFALLILMIVLMNLFMGCSITRKVNKERQEITTETSTDETVKTISDITTQATEQVSSITNISENCDTVITVQALPTGNPDLDEYLKSNPLKLPVKFNRVTQKQEYTNRQESKKENTQIDQNKKQQETSQAIINKKNVDQKSDPLIWPWVVYLVVSLIIIFFIIKSGILKKIFTPYKP